MVASGLILLLLTIFTSIRSIDYLNDKYSSTALLEEETENNINDEIEILSLTPIDSVKQNEKISTGENINKEIITVKTNTDIKVEQPSEEPKKEKEGAAVKKETSKSAFPTLKEIKKNYNTFRGPYGNGIAYAKNIPVNWDAKSSLNIKWKVEVPKHGYNSPVIWNDKLFIAGGDEIYNLREIAKITEQIIRIHAPALICPMLLK